MVSQVFSIPGLTKRRISCHYRTLSRSNDLTIKLTPGFVPFVIGCKDASGKRSGLLNFLVHYKLERYVEMIIDHWNPRNKKYRFETFCYGSKSCRFYKAGPTRKVPRRQGVTSEEEDWVDEDAASHRGMDE